LALFAAATAAGELAKADVVDELNAVVDVVAMCSYWLDRFNVIELELINSNI
jgi:hypothetical protein